MEPQIRFCTTADGLRIAYSTVGDGPPLVLVRGWLSHLELHWTDWGFRSYVEALANHYRVVRYDVRGNGLSQRDVPEIDLEGLVLDLEAVVDELALSDVILYGATFGGPISVTYAVRRPERVRRLILDGTYACGQELASPERQDAIIRMIRHFPDMAYQRLLASLTHPEPEQTAYRRASPHEVCFPDVAAQLYALCYRIDVSGLLPEIRVPTLVLHRRGSRAIRFHQGREVASLLPDARFVPLEGTAHNSWEGDSAAALAAIGDFLDVKLELAFKADTPTPPGLATILFTDMESSTTLTQRLGDGKAQELLRTHNTIVRDALRAHGGSEIKHTGDGIMASFHSASGALECAVVLQRSFEEHNETAEEPIKVRVGLNAGEPIAEEEDLFGTAVIVAARIAAKAEGGEIIASDVVRQLVAGKGFLFSDRGDTALRGFEDPVRLFEVRWREV